MADGKTKKQRRVESLTERLDYTRARIDELLNVFDARIHELEAATPALADALRSASARGADAPSRAAVRARCRAWWRDFLALADVHMRVVNGELRAGPAAALAPPPPGAGRFRYEAARLSLIHIPSPRDGLLSRMPSSA